MLEKRSSCDPSNHTAFMSLHLVIEPREPALSTAKPDPNQPPQSPFLPREPSQFRFGIMLYVLLSVVAAGVALQLGLAMQVPSFRSEVYAWLGMTAEVVDRETARRSQLFFLLTLYSLPVLFGGVVGLLYSGISYLSKTLATHRQSIDQGFEMD